MKKFLLAFLLSAAMAVAMAAAGGPAPAAQPPSAAVDCTTVIYSMMDCIDYVSPGSNETKPSESCCSGVDSVVQLDPFCLCEAIEASAAMNISLNTTKIFDLPSTCNVAIPDLHNCTRITSPAPAPAPGAYIPAPESAPAASPAAFSPTESTGPASDGWGPAPTVSASTSFWFGNPSSAIAFAAAFIVPL